MQIMTISQLCAWAAEIYKYDASAVFSLFAQCRIIDIARGEPAHDHVHVLTYHKMSENSNIFCIVKAKSVKAGQSAAPHGHTLSRALPRRQHRQLWESA